MSEPHKVVGRDGTDGRRITLTVEPGGLSTWPVKLTVGVGYGDTTTLHLSADEAVELISAVELQVGPDPRVREATRAAALYRALFEHTEKLCRELRAEIDELQGGGR
jgi:hypothetical protein